MFVGCPVFAIFRPNFGEKIFLVPTVLGRPAQWPDRLLRHGWPRDGEGRGLTHQKSQLVAQGMVQDMASSSNFWFCGGESVDTA